LLRNVGIGGGVGDYERSAGQNGLVGDRGQHGRMIDGQELEPVQISYAGRSFENEIKVV